MNSPTEERFEDCCFDQQYQNQSFRLQSFELSLFSEIKDAMHIFPDEKYLKVSGPVKNLLQALNLPALYIRKIVKICKSIASFKSLQPDDQLVVLKHFFAEILLIRFAFVFNLERDGFPIVESELEERTLFVELDVYREWSERDIVSCFRRFLVLMNLVMEKDENIRDLVVVLLLFKCRDAVTCPEYFRYQHFVYSRLLKRYLEQKYKNEHKAEMKLSLLMKQLDEIDYITDTIREVYVTIDASQLAKVIVEIYDLAK